MTRRALISSQPLRRQRTWIALLGVVVMFLGLSAEGLHGIAQPHRVCAVHGAIEHGHGAEIGAHAVEAHGDDSSNPGPAISTENGDGAHEGCSLVTFGRERLALALSGPGWSGLAEPAPVRFALPVQIPRQPSIATFRLAPKHSPPAA